MQRNLARIASLLLVLQLAWSQAVTGSISGSVTDKSGAAVPSAHLTLVNKANGAQRTVQTNDGGQFVINSVDPGEYSITVQATGFKTLQHNGVILSPSDILSVGNLALDLGTVEEKVTVTAEGTTVQTASGERSGGHHQRPDGRAAGVWARRHVTRGDGAGGGRSHRPGGQVIGGRLDDGFQRPGESDLHE